MRYRVLSKQGIDAARKALIEHAGLPDLSQFEVVMGAGETLEEARLKIVSAKIRKIQLEISKRKLGSDEVDRRTFDIIHQSIPRDELLLANMDFWTRFAIVHLADVIRERFQGRKGKTNLDNYGLGRHKECWPYKLWVRGELSYDEKAKDMYRLGRFGGIDIWTSHIHRQNFMTIRQMCRSVLTFQYPGDLKGKPLLFEGEEDDKKGGRRPGLRTLIKRLRENWACVEYSMLSDSEAMALVRIHSKGLHKSDGTPLLEKN